MKVRMQMEAAIATVRVPIHTDPKRHYLEDKYNSLIRNGEEIDLEIGDYVQCEFFENEDGSGHSEKIQYRYFGGDLEECKTKRLEINKWLAFRDAHELELTVDPLYVQQLWKQFKSKTK